MKLTRNFKHNWKLGTNGQVEDLSIFKKIFGRKSEDDGEKVNPSLKNALAALTGEGEINVEYCLDVDVNEIKELLDYAGKSDKLNSDQLKGFIKAMPEWIQKTSAVCRDEVSKWYKSIADCDKIGEERRKADEAAREERRKAEKAQEKAERLQDAKDSLELLKVEGQVKLQEIKNYYEAEVARHREYRASNKAKSQIDNEFDKEDNGEE